MRTCVTGPNGENGDDLSRKNTEANKQSRRNSHMKGGR